MTLHVEIKPDFEGTVSVVDYSMEFNEYIPEDLEIILPRYYHFKYSDTVTLNVLRYMGSNPEEIVNIVYSSHDTESDSVILSLPKDGYYIIDHIVLPTYEWYEKVKDEDLSEYQSIYFSHNNTIYKVVNGEYIETDVQEIIERNPRRTTLSCEHFQVFSLDRLKHCFVSANKDVVNNFLGTNSSGNSIIKCKSKTVDTFNRDFLFMTIHAIKYLLECGQYEEAQSLLNQMTCYDFCPNESNFKFTSSSCGCRN